MRELREDNDWTQQYVAGLLFINRRTYCAYENGVNAISLELLVCLSRIYDTSVDYILGLTHIRNPYPGTEYNPQTRCQSGHPDSFAAASRIPAISMKLFATPHGSRPLRKTA
jgi:transcriptional regulator with XRE-family HTH domain